MKTIFLSDASAEKRVVALGSFDGVHLAHREVLKTACERAAALAAAPTVFTFTADPSSLLGRPQKALCTFEERERRLFSCGIEEIVYADFDETMRSLPPEDFFRLLCERLTPVCLVCGYNYTFGRGGEGDTALLKKLCDAANVALSVLPPVTIDGKTVSATLIRDLIEAGGIMKANLLLGTPFTLYGTVSHGEGNGRAFGFPTVNLPLSETRVTPAYGVYVSRVRANGQIFPAVTDVGTKPTVAQNASPAAESFLFDFSGDLYGKEIAVELLSFLRPEQKFPSRDALIRQISADAEAAKRFFDE